MGKKIRIGALISGGGTNLQAIIKACEAGKIDGRVVFAGSDNPEAGGLQQAKKYGIPTFVVDYASIIRRFKREPDQSLLPDDFDLEEVINKQTIFPEDADTERVNNFIYTRAIAEARLIADMTPYGIDLLVLAGFMRNFTPYFIDRVNMDAEKPRIMNIHPALLPSFPGIDGYGDTFRYGCKVGGCTVHFIDYGEDSGPIIGQRAFQIQSGDTLESIRAKGLKLEWELYAECIQLYALGRLSTAKMAYTQRDGRKRTRTIVQITTP